MASYSYQGLCYATPADLLPAFRASYPYQDANFVTYLAASPVPTISNGGLIAFRSTRLNLANGNTFTGNFTAQMQVCTKPDLPFDYSVAGGFFAFGFAGVMTMFFTSHVIGLVLKVVRDH